MTIEEIRQIVKEVDIESFGRVPEKFSNALIERVWNTALQEISNKIPQPNKNYWFEGNKLDLISRSEVIKIVEEMRE